MRFCKQRDTYSCGAVVALNISKVRGCHVTYHDLPYYQNLIGCQKWIGTQAHNISSVFGRACRRSWKSTKKFLIAGNCIIILVRPKKQWGHFYLMTIDEHRCIVVINKKQGVHYPSTVQIVPQTAATLLRHAYRTWYVEKGTG